MPEVVPGLVEVDVARHGESSLQVHTAVRRTVVVVEHRAFERDPARVVEPLIGTQDTELAESDRRHELERRAGCVDALRRAVQHREMARGVAERGVVRGTDAADPLSGVVRRIARHGDNGSVAHVEHDRGAAGRLQGRPTLVLHRDVLLRARGGNALRERGFGRGLISRVDSELHVVTH